MARVSSSTTSKEKGINKAVVGKIAEEAAKKAAKKVAKRVAEEQATKTATKVAAKATLDPDFSIVTDEDEKDTGFGFESDDNDELEIETPSFSTPFRPSWARGNEEERPTTENDLTGVDIFTYGLNQIKSGTPVLFYIKKNGQFLTTVRKPYSEDELQKDHGEGHYLVIVKNASNGQIMKQQTLSIMAPSVSHTEVEKAQVVEKMDKAFESIAHIQEQSQISQAQMMERILEEQRRRDEEERERRREERELAMKQEQQNQSLLATVLQASMQKPSSDGGMVPMMQLIQSMQQQTTQMILESNKNMLQMMQDSRRDTNQLIERIAESQKEMTREFQRQIENMASKKTEGFDAVKVFEMLNNSRESGLELGLKITELAESMADKGREEKEPKSLTQTVIENLGKIAPLMLAQGGMGGGQAQSYFPPAPVQAAPAPSVAPAPRANPTYKKPKTVQALPAATPATPKAVPTQARPVARPTPSNAGAQGTGTTAPIAKPVTPVATNQEAAKIETKPNDATTKKTVIDLCTALIGQALVSGRSSHDLGQATLNAFAQQQINPADAVRLVSLDEVYKLSAENGLPTDHPELRQYLKDFHDYISERAKTSP